MDAKTLLCGLILCSGARADFFNFTGDPSRNNPADSNEGGAVVSVTFGGVQAGLTKSAGEAQASAWRTFKGGGSSSSIGQQLAIRDALKNGANLIEKAGPLVDHLPWASTAAGEVANGNYGQGFFTAMNGITKAAITGIASTVGASFGSLGGPAGTVAGGVGAGYASATLYDATAGKLFETIKTNLGKREDAAQIKGLASDKMNLGSDPDKTLAETHARYQEFVKARQEKEKAEAEGKAAAAQAAAEAKKLAEARAAAEARKLAEEKAAAAKAAEVAKAAAAAKAAEAAKVAQQQAEAEAARQRLQAAVADSKWDGTAEYSCKEFWAFLSAPVQHDSVGRADPKDDWHKTEGGNMELEIKDREKKNGECFVIRGPSFEHELQRPNEWFGATAHYRITGTVTPDFSMVTSLTVSCRMDPIRFKNSAGQLEREKDKSWSVTLNNIPRAESNDPSRHLFQVKMNMETRELPRGVSLGSSTFVETDVHYVYTYVRGSDENKTLTETIRTTAGAWNPSLPGSNIDIDFTIVKRKGR